MSEPGIFNGNHCTRCGGCIDEGGICSCGYDHYQKIDLGPPGLRPSKEEEE